MVTPADGQTTGASASDYERRVREQIGQYEVDGSIHDLPPIFSEWSQPFLAPPFNAVYGSDSIAECYALGLLDCANTIPGRPRFLSLGCGDGDMEIDIARRLHRLGLTAFDFVCVDLSPILLRRFAERIPPAFAACFVLREGDINRQAHDGRFHGVIANHSLHHMVELEQIFATTHAALHDRGAFITNDMIGRNGHQRWPECRLFVDFFWPLLPIRQRANVQLRRSELEFLDHDCSTSGFEGIRAQDILPLILARGFKPHSFVGYGGFIDPFVDRSFGHNFSPEDPDDLFLIRRIGLLNEILLDAKVIKPTMMMARFVKYDTPEIAYRGRTAAESLRPPERSPSWLEGALADFHAIADDPNFVFRSGRHGARAATHDVAEPGAELQAMQQLLRTQFERIAALEADNEARAGQIAAIQASTSWRLTGGLRWVARRVRGY